MASALNIGAAYQAAEARRRAAKAKEEASRFNPLNMIIPAAASIFTGGAALPSVLAAGAKEGLRAGTVGQPGAASIGNEAIDAIMGKVEEKAKTDKQQKIWDEIVRGRTEDKTVTTPGKPNLVPMPPMSSEVTPKTQYGVGSVGMPSFDLPTLPAVSPGQATTTTVPGREYTTMDKINLLRKDPELFETFKTKIGDQLLPDEEETKKAATGIISTTKPTVSAGKNREWITTGSFPDGRFQWESEKVTTKGGSSSLGWGNISGNAADLYTKAVADIASGGSKSVAIKSVRSMPDRDVSPQEKAFIINKLKTKSLQEIIAEMAVASNIQQ